MFRLLNTLSLRYRAALSVLLFVLVLVSAIYREYQSSSDPVNRAMKEMHGVYLVQPAMDVLYHLSVLRQDMADGHRPHILEGLNALDTAFPTLQEAHATYAPAIGVTPQTLARDEVAGLAPENLAAQWKKITASIRLDPGQDRDAALSALSQDVARYIVYASDKSDLILDPDLDSYYLMDTFVNALPPAMVRLADLGVYAGAQARTAAYGPMGTQTAERYAVFDGFIAQVDLPKVEGALATALREDAAFYGVSPTLAEHLTEELAAYSAAQKAALSMLKKLQSGERLPAAQMLDTVLASLDATHALATHVMEEMEVLLTIRADAHRAQVRNGAIMSIGGLILAVAFFLVVMESVVVPLRRLAAVMRDMAGGNWAVTVPYREARAEIGAMAAAVEVFRTNGLRAQELEDEKIAAEEQARAERARAMRELADSFQERVQGIVGTLASASTELSHTAEHLSQSVSESTAHAQTAAGSANDTYQNVQAVAAASEEMSSTVTEISAQTQRTNDLVSRSMDKVKGADGFASRLQEASSQVRNVLQLISNISSQINLLALNATIESARAGEAGKGFAVVANEVRALAGQTDKSIADIEKVVADMVQASEAVIAALSDIRASVDDIFASSASVASAVEEQAAVLGDVAQNMSVATHKTQTTKEGITRVGEISTRTEQSALEVLSASQDLSSQAETLQGEVTKFIQEIKG